MKYPILDLSAEVELIRDELEKAMGEVLDSCRFILGPNVQALEEEVARYCGCKHGVGVNSGTDALIIGLRALGVKPGDEVITSPFTFFSTGEAINIVGATPVFVDIEPTTFNLDVTQIESKITPRTSAIVPVHLFGQAADMDPICELAEKHGIRILEDAAQGMGGEYKGKKIGSLGHAGALSFFPTKNLGGFGDGGMIVTDDDEVAATARMLRVHGSRKKYINEELGYNSRLDEMQAAILRVKLRYLDQNNSRRRSLAETYHNMLREFPEVVPPTENPDCYHVYHQYTIRVPGARDAAQSHFADLDVGTFVYYPVPLHKLPVYEHMHQESYPVSEEAARTVLSLPMGPVVSDRAGMLRAIRDGLLRLRSGLTGSMAG